MDRNVDGRERVARLVVGTVVLAVSGATFAGTFGTGLGLLAYGLAAAGIVVGSVLAYTGGIGYCPVKGVATGEPSGTDTEVATEGHTDRERRPRRAR